MDLNRNYFMGMEPFYTDKYAYNSKIHNSPQLGASAKRAPAYDMLTDIMD